MQGCSMTPPPADPTPPGKMARQIVAERASVVLVTGFGGTRMVDMLVGDPLPRIC